MPTCSLIYIVFEIHLHLQVDWHRYGVDWEGPVPVDDENTVVVQENPEMLSDAQKQELQECLSHIGTNPFCQEEMLSQFVITKTYVNVNMCRLWHYY